MNFFSPAEVAKNYVAIGKGKADRDAPSLFAMSILAGSLIAFAAVASTTATHTISDVGVGRLITAVVFAFGLPMVIITGAELFTGNNLICISLLHKETTLTRMLRSWCIVYVGNFIGAIAIAALCAVTGQFNYSGGMLAVTVIKTAAAKCSLAFGPALGMGLLCNVLVCFAVFIALSAKDNIGRIAGAYLPVFLFVISGFEHSIANMYYIPAGIFASMNDGYAALAAANDVNLGALSWGSFLGGNLLPVTIGNIIGGILVSLLVWFCFLRDSRKA